MEYIIFIVILLVILAVLYFAFFKLKNKNKFSAEKIKDFQKKLKQIGSNISSKEKIIDADKLYHKILQETWYIGDFWSILKQKPMIICDLDKIWELHKVRNKLVHDFDNYTETFLRDTSKEYIIQIEKLLKKIS